MKIGELSQATGTNVETIRYYERIGLLPKPERTSGNYRKYVPEHAERLNFVRHARSLGFEISDIRSLLDLAQDTSRDCRIADQIVTGHLAAVEWKIDQLEKLRAELSRMIAQCRSGQVSGCRILQALGDRSLYASHGGGG